MFCHSLLECMLAVEINHNKSVFTYSERLYVTVTAGAELSCCAVLTADVYITCICFMRNTGLLAIGFNFGCFQLWKLSIPVLEFVIFHWILFALCFLVTYSFPDCSCCLWLMQQQQQFYGPLIQHNQGAPVPETVGHINPITPPLSCTVPLLCTSHLMWLMVGCWDSLTPTSY